jgi:hypothetical protein
MTTIDTCFPELRNCLNTAEAYVDELDGFSCKNPDDPKWDRNCWLNEELLDLWGQAADEIKAIAQYRSALRPETEAEFQSLNNRFDAIWTAES